MHQDCPLLDAFHCRRQELCHTVGAPCLQAAVEQALPLDAAAERRARGHRVLEGFRELRDCVEKGEAKTLNQCLAESEKVGFYGWIKLGVSSPIGIVYRTGFTIALVIHSLDPIQSVDRYPLA